MARRNLTNDQPLPAPPWTEEAIRLLRWGAMSTLVLLRHGESVWNQENRFTGWEDVDLAAKGEEEALRAGALFRESGLLPDVVHTSLLKRAIRTANIALTACDRHWIPVKRSWRLNERHYGDLQGRNKAETLAEFGDEQFTMWRRSFDTPPPPVDRASKYHPGNDARYAELAPEQLPATEALSNVLERMLPYWYDAIVPDLRAGHVTLVAAHGNSLRGLVMHLDHLTRDDVVALNIPTGIPLKIELDDNLRPLSSVYLDPAAAATAAAKVASQGRH